MDNTAKLIFLAGSLLFGGIQLYFMATDFGIYWPDEIFQSLEPAHYLSFGEGLLPWEYIYGVRWPMLSLVIATIMKLTTLFPLPQPEGYLFAIKIFFSILCFLQAWMILQLLREKAVPDKLAAAGACLFLLLAPSLYFANRALSENMASFFMMATLYFLLIPKRYVWAGICVGLMLAFRPQMALILPGLLCLPIVRENWRRGLLGIMLAAICYMGVDFLVWGEPLRSLTNYLEFNLILNGSKSYGTETWYYYIQGVVRALPFYCLMFLVIATNQIKRSWPYLTMMIFFIIGHSFLGHKEMRFLIPLIPLSCLVLVSGLRSFPMRQSLQFSVLALLMVMSIGRDYRMEDLQHHVYSGEARGKNSALNKLVIKAGKIPDLCGLAVFSIDLVQTGGQSYFHKEVPLFGPRGPHFKSGYYNYAIVPKGASRGFPKVETAGNHDLLFLGNKSCRPGKFSQRVDPRIGRKLQLPKYAWGESPLLKRFLSSL